MKTLLQKISDLNDLVLQGRTMEAFEKYYHEEVVMQENENPPTIGKDSNRKREEEFLKAITEFRGANPLRVAIGDGTTMVEWSFDYTHKDWGVRKYTQISVQEWKEGQIINEKFYYSS